MTSNFLHLLTSTPCTMSVDGEYLGQIDNLYNFEIDLITNTQRIFLEYNPISENNEFLPYTSIINLTEHVYTQNKNIQVIPFPNNHFDILFSPFTYSMTDSSQLIFSENIGKYYISVSNNNQSIISIFSNASLLLNKSIDKINNVKVELKKDILIIEGAKNNDEYYILIFDTNKVEIIFEDIVHSINLTSNQIEILKNLKDISHHSLVFQYDFEKKNSQKYYVYENNICNYPLNFELIPYDFLQCIKLSDENKIQNYLLDNLKNTSVNQLKNYFGDFSEIYFNRHEFSQVKLNYTIMGKSAKNYNFIMDGNKIKDIEEIF